MEILLQPELKEGKNEYLKRMDMFRNAKTVEDLDSIPTNSSGTSDLLGLNKYSLTNTQIKELQEMSQDTKKEFKRKIYPQRMKKRVKK